jgi:hypothetical protein
MHRLMTLIAASMVVAGYCVPAAFAQSTATNLTLPADLHPLVNLDADTLRAQFTRSQLGLKPQTGATVSGIELPFGLSYVREAKGLVMPLDQKNEWGVGIGLNINSANSIELSPSNSLGLVPKRTPGLMLHKRF